MLKRSKDRKVANSVSSSGKTVRMANAFGLPAGDSCPGKTSICGRVCYAGKIERIPYLAGPRNTVKGNFQELLYADYLGGWRAMAFLLDEMLWDFEAECEKFDADKNFRIHWDGDFWSLSYAKAWENVIMNHPEIQFWVYTRSFTDELDVIPVFEGLRNLTLYLSVDNDNRELAHSKYPDHLWASLGNDFDDAANGMEWEPVYKCPENRGSLPLIAPQGSACQRCGVCIEGRGDVLFSATKK